MANVRVAQAALQAMMDAFVDRVDAGASAGALRIYDGTQPADANTAISTQVLLAELTFSDPAFGATNTSGVATANAITQDSAANATGVASWARITDSDGNVVFDCDVGESADSPTITLNNKNIQINGTVEITSFTLTHPDGT